MSDAANAIDRSDLLPAGRIRALSMLLMLQQTNADIAAVPTMDGGFTFELTTDADERDLLFAFPDDGTPLYFTARDHDGGDRRAGIVTDDAAIPKLLDWLNYLAKFPTHGIELG